MNAGYNLQLNLHEDCDTIEQLNSYEEMLQSLRDENLLGQFHVTQQGRLIEGLLDENKSGKSSDETLSLSATFVWITNQSDPNISLNDMVGHYRGVLQSLTNDDPSYSETKRVSEALYNYLLVVEKVEQFSQEGTNYGALPFGTLMSRLISTSRQIRTPGGSQVVNFLVNNIDDTVEETTSLDNEDIPLDDIGIKPVENLDQENGYLRLWRPKGSTSWYNLNVLSEYLGDFTIEHQSVVMSLTKLNRELGITIENFATIKSKIDALTRLERFTDVDERIIYDYDSIDSTELEQVLASADS